MTDPKPNNYRIFIAKSLQQNAVEVSDRWLASLEHVVNEEAHDIFPVEEFPEHIPEMIREIGITLESDDYDLALNNSLINRKAEQLGGLRHRQKASMNQLFREYDVLSVILEEFVTDKTDELSTEFYSTRESMSIMASIDRIVRSILQSTVDAFVSKYMNTIEEQTKKIQVFNSFITHELKTPLQAALLNIELLTEDENTSRENRRDLLLVKSSIKQATNVLKNVVDHSRETAMVLDNPSVQKISLSSLLNDIATQLEETLINRDIDIHISESLGTINSDAAKLRLVFTNILTNAIKYRDPHKVKCEIWVESTKEEPGLLKGVIVRDNGLGIEDSMQNDIFGMGVRANKSVDKKMDNSGHGLGLYLVTEALKELNGTISLSSTVGEGSRFVVRLPEFS